MKSKIKYLIVFFGFMFIAPLTSQAQCSYERQAELSRIASNVQFSYNYEMKGEFPKFSVDITNLTNDIYITEDILYQTVSGVGEKSIFYNTDNLSITFDIYSNDNSCKGDKLLTQYVTIPKYNYFATTDECKENPNFQYCVAWLNTTITIDQFNEELAKYKTIKSQKGTIEELTWQEKMVEFFNQNKTPIILCLIGVCILMIIILFKKYRKGV